MAPHTERGRCGPDTPKVGMACAQAIAGWCLTQMLHFNIRCSGQRGMNRQWASTGVSVSCYFLSDGVDTQPSPTSGAAENRLPCSPGRVTGEPEARAPESEDRL